MSSSAAERRSEKHVPGFPTCIDDTVLNLVHAAVDVAHGEDGDDRGDEDNDDFDDRARFRRRYMREEGRKDEREETATEDNSQPVALSLSPR